MAKVFAGPVSFFRLGPAESDKARCFAVRRGEILMRADVTYHQPWVSTRLKQLEHSLYPAIELRNMIDKIRYGTGSPPPYLEPGPHTVPFVRATDIKDGEIQIDSMLYVSVDQPTNMDKCRLYGGELIIVRSGANTGDCAVVPDTLSGAYAAYDIIVTFNSIAYPRFVATFLDTELGRLQLNIVRGRAAQPHVNAEEVSALMIPLPKMEIQQDLIRTLDAARAERRRKLEEAAALLSSIDSFILKTLGITPLENELHKVYAVQRKTLSRRIDAYSNQPRFRQLYQLLYASKLRVATFGELAERIFSGSTPLAKGDAYVNPPVGVRFIRSGEITPDGGVSETSEVHISHDVHESTLKRSQLERGDLLIAIVGATIGSVGLYDSDDPANINQAIAAVRLRNSEVLCEFACCYMNSSLGQQFLDYFKRPVARANINLEEISEIPILIPPLSLQKAIVAEVKCCRQEASQLRAEAEADWQAAKFLFEEKLIGGYDG